MKITTSVEVNVETLSSEDLANLSNAAAKEIRERRITKDAADPEIKRVYYRKIILNYGKMRGVRNYMDIEKCGLAPAMSYIEHLMLKTEPIDF